MDRTAAELAELANLEAWATLNSAHFGYAFHQ
jgi:hypothetical protein